MIQFLGTDIGLNPPADDSDATVMEALGITKERGFELANAFAEAKKNSYVEVPGPLPELPSVPAFHLGKLIRVAELDADRPNELLLIGYLMGCTVTKMHNDEEASEKRIAKMMKLMATSPEKVYKKMLKDFKTRTKQHGK